MFQIMHRLELRDAMTDQRFPDFYIIGAPKCGTTALYNYLSQHPAIFMPRRDGLSSSKFKEPHYFCHDLPHKRQVRSLEAYLSMFSDAPKTSKIGEASVWYLHSVIAVPEIIKVRPDAKFLVMLRNPVDAVQALHMQTLIGLAENIFDFEEAWRAQTDRAEGRRIPVHCVDRNQLQYGEIYKFRSQIERLFSHVPRQQVLILIYEEFFSDPHHHYAQVEHFLGVPHHERTTFERVNSSTFPQNLWLHRFLSHPPSPLAPLFASLSRLSRKFGFRLGTVARWLVNLRPAARKTIRPEFEQELQSFFASDVANLEICLNRKLDVWSCRPGAKP